MAKNKAIGIPIVCENPHCQNSGRIVNVVSEISLEDLDLFYQGYDGSESADYCRTCGELGVAEDAVFL